MHKYWKSAGTWFGIWDMRWGRQSQLRLCYTGWSSSAPGYRRCWGKRVAVTSAGCDSVTTLWWSLTLNKLYIDIYYQLLSLSPSHFVWCYLFCYTQSQDMISVYIYIHYFCLFICCQKRVLRLRNSRISPEWSWIDLSIFSICSPSKDLWPESDLNHHQKMLASRIANFLHFSSFFFFWKFGKNGI